MTRISDNKTKPVNRKLTHRGFPVVTGAQLVGPTSGVNHNPAKQLGSMVIALDLETSDTGYTLCMSGGSDTLTPWYPMTGAEGKQPTAWPRTPRAQSDSKPLVVSPVTGDSSFPIVEMADLLNMGHPVNDWRFSGKTKFGMVIVNDGGAVKIAYATGENVDDKWNYVGGAAVGSMTGSAPEPSSKLQPSVKELKPTLKVSVLVCTGIPVYESTELTDVSSTLNTSGTTAAPAKLYKSVVASTEDGDTLDGLYMADSYLPEGAWCNITVAGNASDVTPA